MKKAVIFTTVNNTRIIATAIGSIAILLYLFWEICFSYPVCKSSDTGRASYQIEKFLDAAQALHRVSEKSLFPSNMVGYISTSVLLPVLLGTTNTPEAVAMNPERFVFLEICDYEIENGEYIDPWGNPYHFVFDTRNGSEQFYMWSNGQNGINEFGEGDDVCSWKSSKDKTWWRVRFGKTGKKFLDNFKNE